MRNIGLIGLFLCLAAGHSAAQALPPCVDDTKQYVTSAEATEPRPLCDLSFVQIQLESHGRRSGDGPFTMMITGEGTVIFLPSPFDSGAILGPQTYHIPPAKVAEMLDLAKKADFWNLPEAYRPAPMPEEKRFPGMNDLINDVYRSVDISLDDRVKTLRIYDAGGPTGVPEAADNLIYQIADLGGIRLWHAFSAETTAQLRLNGFDFHSPRGGELLIEVTENTNNPDADIEALLALGAPADYINDGHFLLETGLLDAAIDSGRTTLADKLIANGALMTGGQHDSVKSARALAHAAANASPDMVANLLGHHPALVFHTKALPVDKKEWNEIPVITLVGQNKPSFSGETSPDISDQKTVTKQLLDAGADINDRDNTQRSLLDNTVQQGNLPFVTWLIAQHAQVTKESFVPTLSDEMTVLLLKTDPQLDNATWAMIKSNAEPMTKAWLKAHSK